MQDATHARVSRAKATSQARLPQPRAMSPKQHWPSEDALQTATNQHEAHKNPAHVTNKKVTRY